MTGQRFEQHIEIVEPLRAIDVLAEQCTLSRQKLKQVMNKGAVWVTHHKKTKRLRRADKVLIPGQTLHLYYDPYVLNQQPQAPLLVEDHQTYSIWYKPSGLFSQGSKWGDHCTVTRWVEQNVKPERPVFLIHRLDRATSGLIMVGHSKRVTVKLCKMFETREIEKHYRVVVHGHFPSDIALSEPVDGKHAFSKARCIGYCSDQDRSLVEVEIETGRKHQVRCHMKAAGHPVVGDRLYGLKDDSENLQLLSYSLAFDCPVSGTAVNISLNNHQTLGCHIEKEGLTMCDLTFV